MTSALFSPFGLRALTLPNRIVVSPMCQYSAENGSANDWHLMHLGSLALGSPGLLFVEATAVEAAGRITPHCLGLYSDANEAALCRVVQAIRTWTPTKLGLQLAHAGRKGSSRVPWQGGTLIAAHDGGWRTVAPSALAQRDDEPAPHMLHTDDLERICDAFVHSAQRAARIGFDALELHCAHGYLLHEFLSPLANHRSDAYGGSPEKRMRWPLEVFAAVRRVWPDDKPLGVRVSATDWVPGGWDVEQTLAFARALKAQGCDWIDASSGGISPQQKIPLGPGYQVPYAQRIRLETGLATIAVGMITDAHHAEAIVATGEADLVALARGMLWDPRWAWHAAAQLGASVDAPSQYWRSPPKDAGPVFGETKFGGR